MTVRARFMAAAVAVAVAVGLGCAMFAVAAPAQPGDARAAIEAQNRAFIAAFGRGDANAVAALYTENAQVIAPGSAPVSGRAAIGEFWQGSIASGIREVALETIDVESDGALAAETGAARLVGGDGSVTAARYVVVWKNVDGQWMLHRDIWNAGEASD